VIETRIKLARRKNEDVHARARAIRAVMIRRSPMIDDDPPLAAEIKGLISSAANNDQVVGAGAGGSSDRFALSRAIRHNIAVSNEVR